MSEGLEALHHPRIGLAKIDISAEGKQDIAYMPFYKTKQYAAIEKELEAFEIMKNKEVDVHKFLDAQCIEHYNLGMIGAWKLTTEEYDLLKEVLK